MLTQSLPPNMRSGGATSPEVCIRWIGGIPVTSGGCALGANSTRREQESETPSATRPIASRTFSGVTRFRLPSVSSAPQRPPFDLSVRYPTTTSSGTTGRGGLDEFLIEYSSFGHECAPHLHLRPIVSGVQVGDDHSGVERKAAIVRHGQGIHLDLVRLVVPKRGYQTEAYRPDRLYDPFRGWHCRSEHAARAGERKGTDDRRPGYRRGYRRHVVELVGVDTAQAKGQHLPEDRPPGIDQKLDAADDLFLGHEAAVRRERFEGATRVFVRADVESQQSRGRLVKAAGSRLQDDRTVAALGIPEVSQIPHRVHDPVLRPRDLRRGQK